MELLKTLQARHSVRAYTGEPIPEEKLQAVLQAGLLSPSGRGLRPWELIVVRDKAMLAELAGCRPGGAGMLAQADAAIVVLGDESLTDVWVEDCAIVLSNMHLMADSLGLGSCWVQGRLRPSPEGGTAEEFLRACLGFPPHLRLAAMLSLGMPASHPAPSPLDGLPLDKIHRERY